MGNKLCTRQKDNKTLSPSEECISMYVDKLLQCDDINSNIIPDSMESKMYEKFLLKMVSAIKLILEDLHVEVLNHRLKIHLEPILRTTTGTNVTPGEIDNNNDIVKPDENV